MATLKNFNTALYVMRLDADCKYKGLLKIGISNNVERRAKEVGSVSVEWNDKYRAPRAIVMATEMLAQAYAYRKVGRPKNYRQALPVRSGSSEFFNTDNLNQARGFICAAKRRVNVIADNEGYQPEIFDGDETEILKNTENFQENIFNKSFFDDGKIIIIKRATDKIFFLIKKIIENDPDDIYLIINSSILDKKSKLRNFFEKDKKNLVSVAFYPDTNETLSKIAHTFLRNKKISLSSSNINFIVNKCNGDRKSLNNELEKIELYKLNKKEINEQDLFKLINLNENHSVNELIDFCLAKNQKKTLDILNDNIFSNEDCIIITRTMLKKTKRLLKLIQDFKITKNLEKTINNAKPPIFWKEKEITKQQLNKWSDYKAQKLIVEINETELQLKRLPVNSINLVTNFLLEQSI